jgi:hypothetical protein
MTTLLKQFKQAGLPMQNLSKFHGCLKFNMQPNKKNGCNIKVSQSKNYSWMVCLYTQIVFFY